MVVSENVLLERFKALYGERSPLYLVRAPGRVNLIGEHTDYNEGYVLPIAIDRRISMLVSPVRDSTVRLFSLDFDEAAEFDIGRIEKRGGGHWLNYPQGVAKVLQEAGYELRGFVGVIGGDVPVGAGLSSSAACEVAAMLAFSVSGGFEIDLRKAPLLCQRAENTFVGVQCGIMDPYVSFNARAHHALFLDCRSIEHQQVPLHDDTYRIVICNTGVKHELAGTEYNKRRQECESAVPILARHKPGATALRDVTMDVLEQAKGELAPDVFKRCRHVISEDERVLECVAAFERGDLEECGRLMNASHESLRVDYEVSCRELDVMVEIARSVEGVLGARMTGGGFGGCTVNLVHKDAVSRFTDTIEKDYPAKTGLKPEVYVCQPADGASARELS